MTLKSYKICRLSIAVLLAISISVSISLANYYLPIIIMISAMAGMYYCRKQLQTKQVLVDERDYQVAGKAARYTILIYGFLGAVATFILMALSAKEGVLYSLSQYLAFSVCFIMLLNSFLFKYFSGREK